MIDQDLLEILACPLCKTSVALEGDRLVCGQCGRRYRIEDGIPIMLVDEAELPGGARPESEGPGAARHDAAPRDG